MLYYRKAGELPDFRNEVFFFLDAKLLNAQELRMTLVCSKANSLTRIVAMSICRATLTPFKCSYKHLPGHSKAFQG